MRICSSDGGGALTVLHDDGPGLRRRDDGGDALGSEGAATGHPDDHLPSEPTGLVAPGRRAVPRSAVGVIGDEGHGDGRSAPLAEESAREERGTVCVVYVRDERAMTVGERC